jgi:hypothetical protein
VEADYELKEVVQNENEEEEEESELAFTTSSKPYGKLPPKKNLMVVISCHLTLK